MRVCETRTDVLTVFGPGRASTYPAQTLGD
jgi:hypothetical protein